MRYFCAAPRLAIRRPCPHDQLSTREAQVSDPARRRDRLDVVALVDTLKAVPEADTAAEEDRDLHHVHRVDEVGGEELADDAWATADAHVEVAGCGAGEVERFLRVGVDEVEYGATLHLDRRTRVVSEHEHRRVERRVRPPPAAP